MKTNEVWLSLLKSLLDSPPAAPREKPTRERLAYQSVINMEQPVVTVAARKLGYRFLLAEAAWILSGDNRVETIAPYSREIKRFSDDGITFAGAYGPPLADQLSWIVRRLLEDPESRQAVATIWRPRPAASLDVPCTVALQWLIRYGRLQCVATMRSSDAWLGWPYDVFNFSCVSAYVAASLMKTGGRCHQLGNLYLTAGSQHLYEEQWEAAMACLLGTEKPSLSLTSAFVPNVWANEPTALARELWRAADGVLPKRSLFVTELAQHVNLTRKELV